MDSEHHPKQRSHTFTAPKAREHGKQVADDGDDSECQLIIAELGGIQRSCYRRADEISQVGGRPALQDIDNHNDDSRTRPQYAKRIGCAGIAASILADVYPIE